MNHIERGPFVVGDSEALIMSKKKPLAKASEKSLVRIRDERVTLRSALSLRECARLLVDLAYVVVWLVDVIR